MTHKRDRTRFRQKTGLPISGITRKPTNGGHISRRMRRALTLAAAKAYGKAHGRPRAEILHRTAAKASLWDSLMADFPRGTLNSAAGAGKARYRHGR